MRWYLKMIKKLNSLLCQIQLLDSILIQSADSLIFSQVYISNDTFCLNDICSNMKNHVWITYGLILWIGMGVQKVVNVVESTILQIMKGLVNRMVFIDCELQPAYTSSCWYA